MISFMYDYIENQNKIAYDNTNATHAGSVYLFEVQYGERIAWVIP